VAGGRENRAINGYAAVGGGKNNQAGGQQSVVGGGEGNMAGGYHAAVGGGQENVADGDASTVGGGALNEATALGATVSGGRFNTAGGRDATVPGGADNVASGYYSLAAGRRARAEHGGTFVWADSASVGGTDFVSTGSDQFLIRAGGGVGIGTNAPITQFHVVRNISAAATTANHVALIDNSSTGAGADVLALRIARTTEPQTTNAFITFKYGESTSAGFIRGNGTGGVELISETADYAEYLPHLNIGEQLEPGDVVGVFAGKISRGTGGADRIMVISTAPIVVGNHKARGEGDEIGYSRVAFLGQAPVKVTGPVRSGEFLIPSGRGDGTARSVHPADLRVDQIRSVIGTAWDSNDAPGTVRVNAAIGIDQITVAARAIEALHAREKRREEEIASILDRLAVLEARMTN